MTTSRAMHGETVELTPGVVLLHDVVAELPAWARNAGAVARDLAAEGIAGAECVIIISGSRDPLPVARRVHREDADVQVVVIVTSEEERRLVERAMRFAPGIGELWLATPQDIGDGIAQRASGVTRQRRKYRRTRERLERESSTASPQRTERALISDVYLADLLQMLPDPVFSLDAAGRILSANPAATQVLAARPSFVGARLADVLGESSRAAVHATLSAARERTASAGLTFVGADGHDGFGELVVGWVTGTEPALYVAVFHDLSERHREQQLLEDQAVELEQQSSALQQQTAELEQTNDVLTQQRSSLQHALETRSRFYASMSHELRTPINAVIGYSSLALDGLYGSLAEPLRDALSRSLRAANHLRELVDDVLDLAKIEAGRIELQWETVTIRGLTEDILDTVTPSAQLAHTEIALECIGAPQPIVTDPRRVRQILLNLLGNALKFGRGNPVVLRCEAMPHGAVISVVDTGEGIAYDDQARIFEEFVQLNVGTPLGTGLGLPISRGLAEVLGGTLTVRSVPGKGSTFVLMLPVDGKRQREMAG